ncbi:MAG: VPLPA-CTERM sorting domain-containing protein [Methylococcales bacterium]
MKMNKKQYRPYQAICLVPLLAFVSAPTVNAATAFMADSTVLFTLTGISNTTNPGGTISGLDISNTFTLDPLSQFEKIGNTTSNLDFSPTNLSATPSVGDSFSQSLKVSGNAISGEISSYHFAEGILQFTNSSTNEYVVEFSMDYNLAISASGEASDDNDANISLELEYAYPGSIEDTVSLIADLTDPSANATNSVSFSVTVAPGMANKEYYTDLVVEGSAVSAVPIPAAVWLFGSGVLGLTSLARTQRRIRFDN